MGRHIGKRILDACELAQSLGYCTAVDFRKKYQVGAGNSGKYFNRAIGHGLMIVDKSHTPYRYSVVKDWRDKVKTAKPTKIREKPVFTETKTVHLQSVWM